MKKLLLGLGTLAAVAAPVAAVVACGSNDASFGEADKTTQAPALAALATEVQKIGFLTSYPNLTKTEVKGDDVRYTFSDTAADSSSDDTAVATVTTVRLTLSLTDKKVTLIERSTNGKDFTKATLADNLELTTDEETAMTTATATAKEAIDKAVEAAKPAQAPAGGNGLAAIWNTQKTSLQQLIDDSTADSAKKTELTTKLNAITGTLDTKLAALQTEINNLPKAGAGTGTNTGTAVADLAAKVKTANAEIAAALAGIDDTAWATPMAAEDPFYTADITKESELHRSIKIVTSGFVVNLANDDTSHIEPVYFADDATDATIAAEIKTANDDEKAYATKNAGHEAEGKNQHIDGTKTAITSPMVVYKDDASHGFDIVWTPAVFATKSTLPHLPTDVFAAINAAIAKITA